MLIKEDLHRLPAGLSALLPGQAQEASPLHRGVGCSVVSEDT